MHIFFAIIVFLLYLIDAPGFKGRPIWYTPKKLWTPALGGAGDDSSQQLLDIYTLTHVSHGIIFYGLFHHILQFTSLHAIILSIFIETAWELIENTNYIINKYRKTTVSRHYPGDSWVNTIGDIWGTYIGILIAVNTSPTFQAVFVVLVETFLYLYQGDNLLTNILTIMRH